MLRMGSEKILVGEGSQGERGSLGSVLLSPRAGVSARIRVLCLCHYPGNMPLGSRKEGMKDELVS